MQYKTSMLVLLIYRFIYECSYIYLYMYMVFTTEGLSEVAIES